MGLYTVAGSTRLFGDDLRAVGRELAKKATPISFVARWALLIDLQENGVGVTVDQDFDNALHVPTLFALRHRRPLLRLK